MKDLLSFQPPLGVYVLLKVLGKSEASAQNKEEVARFCPLEDTVYTAENKGRKAVVKKCAQNPGRSRLARNKSKRNTL